MADPLFSSRYSVGHAKRHLLRLESEIMAFFGTHPYAHVNELEGGGSEEIRKIRLVKPMPEELPGIAFDAVNNLRSALDHAGFAVARAAGRNGKNAKFPFGTDLREVQARASGSAKDIPRDVFEIMVAAKPYKGGNDLLWALNNLCNTNKHELIIPIATAAAGFGGKNVSYRKGATPGGTLTFTPFVWDSVKNEAEYARLKGGGTFEGEFQFSFFMAIGRIEILGGQPALEVLNAIAGEVENVVTAIEGEARRIGLFK